MMKYLPQWSRAVLWCLLLGGGLPLLAQPANDLCGGAVSLTLGASVDGTTTAATATDLPDGCFSLSEGVWYTFTGTGNSIIIEVDATTEWDPELNLSSGTCDDLTNISCRDGGGTGGGEILVVASDVGTTYYVYVADWSASLTNDNSGDFTINISEPVVPANDDCAAATSVTVNADLDCGTTFSGTISGATDSDSGDDTCGGTADDDVWFSFVATSTTHQVSLINIIGTTTDLYHATWSGTCDALVNVACSDPNTSTLDGLVVGDTYYVQVYSWTATADQAANFDICIGTFPAAPANDECADAVPVAVNDDFECGMTTPGTITSATMSAQGNGTCGGTEDDDVWFSFTATNEAHRIALTNVAGNTTDLYHVVWSGTCDAPVQVNCSDPNTSNLTGLTVGETYLIQVYSWTATAGRNVTFDVCIGTPPPPPAYNDCAMAADVPVQFEGFAAADTFTYVSATPSGLTPAPSCGSFGVGNDVFFSITAPSDTLIIELLSITGQPTDYVATLYSGTCDALVELDCDDDDGPGLMPLLNVGGLTPGETYLLRVNESGSNASGTFQLQVSQLAPAAIVLDCPATDSVFVGADCTAELPDFTADVTADDAMATFTQDSAATSIVGLVNDSISTFDLTITATSPDNPAASTCVISVSVVDTTGPMLVCQDITVDLDSGGLSTLDSAGVADSIFVSASDNCVGGVTIATLEEPILDCSAGGMSTASLIATDTFGNTTTCMVNVMVNDTSEFCSGALVITCGPATDTVSLGDDCLAIVGDYAAMASSNATTVTQTPAAGATIGLGTTTILIEFALDGQLDTCLVDVTVEDDTPPVLVCSDIEVFLDSMGNFIFDTTTVMSMPVTSTSGSIDATDPQMARPVAGGTACTTTTPADHFYDEFDFSIDQEDMYTFTMTPNANGDFYALLYEGGFDASSPCNNFLIGNDDGAGSLDPQITITLTLVPGDYTLVTTTFAGNAALGAYDYTFSSANGGQVLDGNIVPDTTLVRLEDLAEGSTDCSGELSFEVDMLSFDCTNLGANMLTLTATDSAGNVSTCTPTITVSDTLAPIITFTPGGFELDLDGNASVDIEDIADVVDNCDAAPIVTTSRPLDFTCDDIGNQVIVVTATDASGNVAVDSVVLGGNFVQPQLACISRLNVTLNENCQFLVEPSQLLVGNTACLDAFNFDIVVMDGDTSNGPIIDGCGSFSYMITSTDAPTMTSTGFVGDYAEDNWMVTAGADASVTFSEQEMVLTSGGSDDNASSSYQFMEEGEVSFTIQYSLEADIIPDVLVVDFDGNVVFESDDVDLGSGGTETGSEEFVLSVQPGNTLVIMIEGDGFATGGQISEVTVGNFEVTTASLFGIDFETCWGTITAEDKTPPVLEELPLNVNTLLCADVDANNLNTLAPGVSKCYLVDATGATIAGSMAPELQAILSPDAFDDMSPDTALVPIFTDNCASSIEVCVSDVVTRSDDGCGATVIQRYFRANEASGCAPIAPGENDADEEVVATFRLVFVRPTIDSLNAQNIQPVVEIEACGTANAPLEFLPTDQDYPFLQLGDRVISLNSSDATCSMIATTFENSPNPIQTCAFTFKFQRTYTVVDWCAPTNVQTFTQFVKVGDSTGPVVSGPTPTVDNDGNLDPILTYRTNFGNECSALVRLDGPGVGALDECSGSTVGMTVAIYPDGDLTQAPFGAYPLDMNNGVAELSDPLEVGDYSFVYTATDQCGNVTTSTVDFEVVDGSGPAAICETGLNISLSRPTGLAVITPDQVDKGSYDDCSSELTYQLGVSAGIDIMPTSFDDQVTFTCDDLGTQYVTLEVIDEMENSNFCWAEVLVELKASEVPTCIAPGAVTLTCTQYAVALPNELEESTDAELDAAFGFATGVGVCGATTTSEFVNNNLNECGIGTVIRNYTTTDPQGAVNVNSCTQLITIVGIYDYQIVLPGNARTNDCTDEFETDEIAIVGGACDVPVVTPVTEEIFNTPGDECYQIRTTYTIINTCEYDPAFGGTTIITRAGLDVDNTDPIYLNVLSMGQNTEDDDVAFVSSSDNTLLTPGDDDDIELGGYAASTGRGSFTYVQNIDVFDRTAPIVDVAAPADCLPGCTADLTLPFSTTDNCLEPTVSLAIDPDFDPSLGFIAATVPGVVITLDASDAANGNYVINATNLPAGNHALMITATDQCGNATPVVVQVAVCGDVAPVPLCIQTITATLEDDGNGGGVAQVWATDFATDSELLDCFGNPVTKYGIVRAGEGPATVDMIGLEVTCADFGDLVSVEVYAFDDAGNEPEFCSVLIEIQEGDGVDCGSAGGNLTGTIMTPSSGSLQDVMVTLTGSDDMDMVDMTNEEGEFNFASLPLGGDYTVTPILDAPINLREVKISDVVMISSVILGTNQFETAYDYLAADVDQSKNLNVLDMVAIQRVILGIDNNFASGDSWGFVTADANVTNPYASTFPNVYNANDLQANILDADFVGFAYGNVIGEGRSAMSISTADAELAVGETHSIVIDAEDLVGFQGTFQLAAGLELIAADYTGEGALNLNYAAEGLVAVALRGDATLTLEVRATEAGTLSELVSLTDAITVREGVAGNGTSGSLTLNFGPIGTGELVNSLGDATPNPVIESTLINFTLAQAGDVTLTIQDIQGRTVLVRNLDLEAGANNTVVTVAELKGASGVLTYTITAGDFSATKKMVVVR